MSIRIRGITTIPSGRERRAELTWLTQDERRAALMLDDEAFTGDVDLRVWMYRHATLGTHFSLRADSGPSYPLDLDKPVSVLAAMLNAFEWGAVVDGEDVPDAEPEPLPDGAIP